MSAQKMQKIQLSALVSTLAVGGAEQLLLELLKNLDPGRFRINLCFLRDPGMLGAEVLRQGFPAACNILRRRWDLAGMVRLARLLAVSKTDLVLLINHRNTLFYGTLAAKLAGVKAIVNWENETHKKYSLHALTMLGRRVLHLGIDKVVAAAACHKDYIAAVEKIPAGKIQIIYNGVDPGRFQSRLSGAEARARLDIPDTSPTVAMVAVLRKDKAHHIFLKAARIVLSSSPRTRFLIVGDGPQRDFLSALARDLGIADNVHFLGFRRELADIFAAVDVCALSSNPEQETLSVAAIEAMSAGVPVVCTDVGCMNEIVIPGKTGFLVAVGDPHGLAERLDYLVKNPDLRHTMGEQARGLVLQKLSAGRMADAFADLFTRLCAGK